MQNYDDIFFEKYILAYNKLKKILKKINLEYSNSDSVNPIENMKFRLKKIDSLENKLVMRNLEVTTENVDKYIRDVIGCRIVCSFLSDIEILKNEIIKLQNNGILKIVEIKDYIKTPKENGYSSYHIIVSIPVVTSGYKKIYVNAEIQLRTVAMDMSFSLEHKIAYKKGVCPNEIREVIDNISDFCRIIDKNLDSVIKYSVNNVVERNYRKINGLDKIRVQYSAALDFILSRFGSLYDRYEKSDKLNPIEHFKGRIKTDSEIIRKLENKGLDVNVTNIVDYINDFAGIRVVCSFLDDIEVIKDEIRNMERRGLIKIIKEKDYIGNPKESGYRGYHFLVSVPLYLSDVGIVNVKVEIQLRTVAMEMWASLEEKIGYNKNPDEIIKKELVRLSSIIEILEKQVNDVVLKYGLRSNNKVKVKKKNNV